MAEDTKAQQNQPVKETQESAMPAEEQQTADIPKAEGEQPVQAEQPQAEGEGELPEGVKERTTQEFEKLREKLRTERQRRMYLENAFDRFEPQQQQQAPPVYDPNTGLINEQALTNVQRQASVAEQRAARAEQSLREFKLQQEEREAFGAYPELNPLNKSHNKAFHRQVRAILTDAMLNPDDYDGRQLSFKEAADLAKRVNPQLLESAKKEGAKEAIENLTPKEQASLEATGTPARRRDVETDLDTLKKRSRKGDLGAIVERLKKVGGEG